MPESAVELLDQLRCGVSSAALDRQFPFYPLDAPGMPLPGPDFVRAAVAMGDPAPGIQGKGSDKRLVTYGAQLHYLYRRALYDCEFQLPLLTKGRATVAKFVPGHQWGADTSEFGGGPLPSDVLILGKCPGVEEVSRRRNLVGPTSQVLIDALGQMGVSLIDTASWYVTNLCKFPMQKSDGAMPKDHIKDCEILFAQELRLVLPRYILCLGSDASKFLLGTEYSVTNMAGRVVEYKFPIHGTEDEPRLHTCQVMAITHPAAVARTPELLDEFIQQLGLFWQLINGGEVGQDERDIDHGTVYSERLLAAIVDEALADPNPEATIIAVDGEWEGQFPTDKNAYLRSIQFSYKDKWARTVALRDVGGKPLFEPSIDAAIGQLRRLLKSTPERAVRVGGHFLRADMPWFMHAGLDLRAEYAPLADPQVRDRGGWDTSAAYHAYNETARYKLEDVATRLTTVPRYDKELQSWKVEFCKQRKYKADDLEGYGECPGHILYPYGAYDADATRRIIMRLLYRDKLLFHDPHGNDAWYPYWVTHNASLAFLEMELTGFVVDRQRADELTSSFMLCYDRLLGELRAELNWPTFNPASAPQRVAMLFGDQYSTKLNKVTGEQLSIRPAGAVSLGLKPIKSTGKRAKMWADIVARGDVANHSPSTDKESLGILGQAHPVARKLRDLSFIGTVLRTTLRRPLQDDDGEFMTDESGNLEYDKGLVGSVSDDGILRTHLSQVKETGRAASSRPNLQAISSRREADYKRIIGETHKHPVRSVLMVPPGWVGIEADISGAELAVLAWQSQDPLMIDHVRRNLLPESDPDYYSIHGRTAVNAFRLDCAPTKKGLKDSGNISLYTAAKNVVFGVPYGRGGLAIARQCQEEGADVSESQAEMLIEAYHHMYRAVEPYLAECRARSQDPGWIVGPHGRFRRFQRTSDRSVIGEQQRQAQNFTIQNGVADHVSQALYQLYNYRFQFHPEELWYNIAMQVHDSIVVMCPAKFAARVYHEVLPDCLTRRVPFWPRHLDGRLRADVKEPYFFGSERKVFIHWGESITEQEAEALGLPESLLV